jgi:hypothetical protein
VYRRDKRRRQPFTAQENEGKLFPEFALTNGRQMLFPPRENV